ncbi:Quercetin 2,3-dioxygenase [Candidatus Nitrotoga sp. HW29]|uniref:pirin family protein n=1 Tax=Candidatus Nitrotoga sp. HW29 TaxID=2886963 RepID=UPI001EF3C960|nr:pirin family protein [Candidatus Nitrotoga sp. HW29]CAH1905539.1 Quercetin 2,3-dioxygenase [Candidatus Nitrotoga sp. HW29]
MIEIRPAQHRGTANFDWLFSRHTFSFGNYYDPQQSGFSDLLVINDDIVQAGKGFNTHPHRDMEIFTYVIDGALAHKDSMGTGSAIKAGDVQLMSAGTGITHSEFNHSQTELVHFLQIWLVPDKKGVQPRYQQSHFSQAEKQGRLQLIISPDGTEKSLSVYQDVRVYAGCFNGDEQAQLTLVGNRYAYVHIVRGVLTVNGTVLNEGDGARIRNESLITLQQGQNAEVLVFDLRPNEQPEH